jgi:citrate lyase subunit beta/citryl-CoA lyase
MTSAALPVWRSLLFVPVTRRRFLDGAARRGADAIILDLEDSVAASEKERARTLVPQAVVIVSRGGADVVVRTNRPLRLAVRDIEAAVGPRVLALALPKTDSAEHVRLIAEIVDEVEAERGVAPGTTRLIAMVETAGAFFRLAEIARAHRRLCALNLGAEDFATSAGIAPVPEALSMPKQMAVIAARAAGIMPLGFIGSIAEFHDLDGFRSTIRRSRRFGFIGASVIHPSQVPILNEEFRPRPDEVDHARRVVAAYDKALAEGVGAVAVDGKIRCAGRRAGEAAAPTRGNDRRPRGDGSPRRGLIRGARSGNLISVGRAGVQHVIGAARRATAQRREGKTHAVSSVSDHPFVDDRTRRRFGDAFPSRRGGRQDGQDRHKPAVYRRRRA